MWHYWSIRYGSKTRLLRRGTFVSNDRNIRLVDRITFVSYLHNLLLPPIYLVWCTSFIDNRNSPFFWLLPPPTPWFPLTLEKRRKRGHKVPKEWKTFRGPRHRNDTNLSQVRRPVPRPSRFTLQSLVSSGRRPFDVTNSQCWGGRTLVTVLTPRVLRLSPPPSVIPPEVDEKFLSSSVWLSFFLNRRRMCSRRQKETFTEIFSFLFQLFLVFSFSLRTDLSIFVQPSRSYLVVDYGHGNLSWVMVPKTSDRTTVTNNMGLFFKNLHSRI